MNAAPHLVPTDIRACAIDPASREKTETLARAHRRNPLALRCIINIGITEHSSKQRPSKRGASINARSGIAGQSTAQK